MRNSTLLAALTAAALSCPLGAAEADLSKSDQKYLAETAQGLLSEIELGEMAQKRGQDERVKQFGKRMVDDHGRDLSELKQLAAQKNVSLPPTPDRKQRKEVEKLARLSGPAFDKEYVNYEAKDHKDDVREQGKEMNSTADPDLKKFATAAYTTVSTHRQIVDHLKIALTK